MSGSSAANTSRSSGPGSFLIVIENVSLASASRTTKLTPLQLPQKYTWQDLKDLIRREASHGIWTEMALYPNGKTGGKGHVSSVSSCYLLPEIHADYILTAQARVKRPDEARNLYCTSSTTCKRLSTHSWTAYLTTNVIENRRLRIHLWDIGGSTPTLLRCNCNGTSIHPSQSYPAQGQEVTQMALAPGWQVMTPMSSTTASQTSYPATPATSYGSTYGTPATSYVASPPPMPQPVPVQAPTPAQLAAMQQQMMYMRIQTDPIYAAQYQQRAQAMQAQQVANQQASRYTYAPNGLPINTVQGAIRLESRGVFVSGLNYKARSKDVEALFAKAGEISRCEVQKDASTGKSKGKATIQYSSAGGAQQAIDMFNEKRYMDMTLRVRLDTEKTALVSPPAAAQATSSGREQPVIVDGSLQVRE